MKLRGNLIVVSAPSGAGKTTLCSAVLKSLERIAFSISYTTRKPREGEVNGVDYYFVSEKDFKEMIDRGEFAEWAVVHGNYYGTSRKTIDDLMERNIDVLLDIDVQGAKQIKVLYPEAVLVFIMPPSFEELKKRLYSRGAENLELRLRRAFDEMKEYYFYNYVIINDNLEKAISDLRSIIISERLKVERFDPDFLNKFYPVV
ncbi:MAG: guanylate kinase [Thermodesulfovibrionales bacterium]|nr:guanylate kinase [Thermodesulfovibrionales bacterium]